MSSTEKHYRTDKRLRARIDLHTRFSVNPYGWYRWVFDQFDLPRPCRILEIACGTGRLWNENAYRIHPSWDLVLTDRSEAILGDIVEIASVDGLSFLNRRFRKLNPPVLTYFFLLYVTMAELGALGSAMRSPFSVNSRPETSFGVFLSTSVTTYTASGSRPFNAKRADS